MRSGDPRLATAAKTWSAKNASWNVPVQRSMAITDMSASKVSAPASISVGPIAERQQQLDGDFNVANGGTWPRGNVKY